MTEESCFDSRQDNNIYVLFKTSRPVLESKQPSYLTGTGVKSMQGLKLTIHCLLMHRLRIGETVFPLPTSITSISCAETTSLCNLKVKVR